jgi:hypothetical protein
MFSRPLQVSRCLPTGKLFVLPINGTASDVEGIFSATKLRNTVNERSMVTPVTKISDCILNISVFLLFIDSIICYRVFSYNAAENVRLPTLCVCASHCNCQRGRIVRAVYNTTAVRQACHCCAIEECFHGRQCFTVAAVYVKTRETVNLKINFSSVVMCFDYLMNIYYPYNTQGG